MKNKLCYVLLGILLSFSFMNNVFAEDFSVSLIPSSNTVVKGSEAAIKINIKSSEAIAACRFKFSSDDNIEYVSIANANGWVVNENGENGVLVSSGSLSSDSMSSGVSIVELKYKVNGDGKVTVKTEQCVSVNEMSYTFDDVSVNFAVTEPVDDTSLKSITVTGGVLNPNFNPEKYSYVITNLSSPKFGLTLIANDESHQDDIVVKNSSGEVINDLSNIIFKDESGQGMMQLTVAVADKTKYSITVNYTQKDLKSDLKSVTINGEQLPLVDGVFEYEYSVGKDVKNVEITAEVKDSENFKIGSASNAPGTFTIKDSIDVIIVVEPKSPELGASLSTYTIRIIKEGVKVEDEKPSGDTSSGNNTGGSSSSGNTATNPETGDISMFIMAFILISSLTGSVFLYQKNMESYK